MRARLPHAQPPAAILVVDDSSSQRMALRAILEPLGEEIVEASSGDEALRELLRRKVAVILLDVKMPGMDGFETATLIRSRPSLESTPILFLTADPDEAHAARGYALGAVDFILKPVDAQILKVKVGVFLELFRGREEVLLQARSLQSYTEQLQRLAQAALEIHRSLSLEDLLQTVTDSALSILGTAHVAIDVDPATMGPLARFHPSWTQRRTLCHPSESDLPRVIREVLVGKTPGGPLRLVRGGEDPLTGPRECLAAPLLTRERRLTGWLCVAEKLAGEYTANDETLLVQLAQLGALAIENVLLSEAEQTQQIGNSLARELDEERLLQLLTEEATQRTGAAHGSYFFGVDKGDGQEYLLCSPPGSTSAGLGCALDASALTLFFDTFDARSPVRLADVRGDPRFASWVSPDAVPAATSFLAVPVIARGGTLRGGLLLSHGDAGHFTLEHERTVTAIAHQAATALENARLYSELRRSEARARAAYDAVAAANRQKDQFLATLSHELRNPLAPIITGVELLRVRGKGGSEVDVIERHARSLVHLIDDLLDLSRIQRGRIDLAREPMEIERAIRQAIETAQPLLEQKGHDLCVQVSESGLCVDGDAVRLTQVFSNLLTNAAKFTDDGGKIQVSAHRSGEQIVVSVEDNGVGIAADSLPVLFQEFMQVNHSLDRSQGGLGLGLSIARKLVEMHGGSIDAESDGAGRGSCFIVRLPVSSRRQPAAPPPALSTAQATSARPRILVVDDNVDAADMLGMLLHQAGYDVCIAFDGKHALQVARERSPELAILDIGLPEMSGYELAPLLRESIGAVPLIALSGYGQESDRELSRQAGFNAHLVKPVNPSELEATIQRLARAGDTSRALTSPSTGADPLATT